MATEVDSQEPISLKIKEGEENGSLTPLNLAFNLHPLGEMKELESMHNQPLETTNYVGQTGYMEVTKDIELDNENTVDVKEVEGEFFLQSPLLPKIATEGTSSAKKDYEASDIPNLAKGEMSKNETLKEEQVINQYSDTVATKEDSREENPGGLEEDRSKGSQDDEKEGIMMDENNESESYDQIVNIQEANSGQSTGEMTHKVDMTEDSKMGTGKLPETCDIEVNRDITLSTTTESSEESLRESNYHSGVDKESELSFISEVEKMNPEAIKPSKEIQDRKDREDMLKNTEDVYISTKSVSTVKQNEEATENGQGATVRTILMNELIEETIAEKNQKTAPDKGGDIDEKDQIFIEDKTKIKPEICQDEMESETTAKISENEAGKQDESTEKNVIADSNMNRRSNDNEDPESTEAPTGEYKEDARLVAFVDENNNTAEKHSNTKTLKQNLERFLDGVSEEIQKSTPTLHADIITYSEEKRPTESLEENLEEENKEREVHLNEIEGKDIQEQKNLSKDYLNENTEIVEVVSLHETANETYEADPTVEEIQQLGCGEQDQVYEAIPMEQVCEENKILTEEEKHVNEIYEESRNLEIITYSEEKRPAESLEENFEEEEKERTIHLNEIKGNTIPEENNFLKDDLNENIEIAQVVSLHKTANETYETDPSVEEIKRLGCGEQDQVSKAIPIEQVSDENKLLTQEEKHINETYEESGNLETITYFKEKRSTESLEENLEEGEKERTFHLNEIKEKEIPEEKNLSKDYSNEDIGIAEVASLHETANKTYETNPPVNPSNGCDTQCTTITSEEISPKETNEDLVKNSLESQVFEKEGQEKILEKAEISVTGEAEEKILNKGEQEEKMQLDNPDLASEEKGLVITVLSETRSNDIDIIDKLPEASNMSESKDMHIPKAETDEMVMEAGDKQEHELQDETHNTLPKTEDEREISTGEITLDYTTEGILEVYSELHTESRNTGSEESDTSKSINTVYDASCSETDKLETPNNAKLSHNELCIDKSGDKNPVNYQSDEACNTCTDNEKVIIEQDNSAEASTNSLMKYVEIEKAVVELETGHRSEKPEDFSTDNTSTIKEENLELHEQIRSSSELADQNQIDKALPETSVKDNNIEDSEEKIIIPDLQTGELEMNKEVEEVHGGVELAEEIENVIEQIREESCATELQTQLASAETINEINESDPVTIVNHEAYFSENKETASRVVEDLNWESEADMVTKPPEEEIDEGTEKHINISSSALEVSGDILKEEKKEETDTCNGKMDTAPVKLMIKETSLEEIHLDDNPVLALDSTSDDRSLGVKTTHTTVHGAESDSPRLEECSCKVPQLITTEHANPDKESGLVQKPNADEVEVQNPKTSNTATNSKEQNVEDILETGESQDRTDTHKVENELNEVLEATAKSKYQGVEVVIESDDLMSHQPLPTGNSTEQLVDPFSSMPPKEQDHETTLKEKCEDKSRKNDEILVNESSEASVATNAKHETCLLKENSRELEVATSECEIVGNKEDDSPDEEIKEESITLHKATASEPEENSSKMECTEQNFDATCLREETIIEVPKDEPKSNQDCKTQGETVMEEEAPSNESTEHLVRNSKESQAFDKETKEEILKDVVLRVMDITEETNLKKVEQENILQVKSTGLESEDKGPVITGVQETGSDDVCIKAKIVEASEMSENKDMQIPKKETDEVSGAGEETKQEQENKTEGSETTNATSENVEASYTYTPLESDEKEENLLQREENYVDPISETDMASGDIEKSSINEKVQDEDINPYTTTVLNSDKKISQSEEVEPDKCIKSTDVSKFREDDELETFSNEKLGNTELEKSTFEDEKTASDASVCDEACNTDTNNAVPEQENSAGNSKSSLTEDVKIERAVVEAKSEDLSHKIEESETTSASIISDENFESIESWDQCRSAPESVAENQSSKQLPQDSAKDQKSECREEKINGQDFREKQIEMTEEASDSEKQINRGQDQTAMIKDVILTEEVSGGYQKTDESDNIKEEIIKEESFPKERQMASRLTEIGNEIKDSEPLPSVNLEAKEFGEDTETRNSRADESDNIKEELIKEESFPKELQVASRITEMGNELKDSEPLPSVNLEATEFSEDAETRNSRAAEYMTWDLEASSNMKLPKEDTKTCIEKSINITSSAPEISGETVEEANTGEANDAPVTLKTEETSLEEGHLHDKSVWACDTASYDKNLGEITGDATLLGAGAGSLIFEESSGGISQLATSGQADTDKDSANVENPNAESKVEIGKLGNTELEKSTFEDEKTASDASVCDEACNTDTNNAVPEQENSTGNSKRSLTEDVEIGIAVVEAKSEDLSHKIEESETSASIISDENFESIESWDQFRSASESVAENQSRKQLPQDSAKDQKSECREEKINEQDFREKRIKMTEEASDSEKQINRGQDQTAMIKDVILTEEVSGGYQKTDESDNIKEEIIKEENFPKERQMASRLTEIGNEIKDSEQLPSVNLEAKEFGEDTETRNSRADESDNIKEELIPKELQMASRLTEMGNELKDSEPLPSVNLEATEFSEDGETRNSRAAEYINWDLEASSNMKLPKEDTKTCIEKSINITSSAPEISGEIVEEANTGEANDAPVTLKTEETSLEEGHLHDKSVWACDTASYDKNLGEITGDATLLGAGAGSLMFEESSGGISQLATIGQADTDKESANVENPNAESKVEKIITSDAVPNPEEQVVQDILGQGKSPTMDRTGRDKPEEEINEVSEAICEPTDQGAEALIEGDIIPNQTLSTGDSTDQLLEPSSSETRTTEEREQKSSKNNETLISESSDGSFATSKEVTYLQKNELRELEVSSFGLEENKQNDCPDEAKKIECTTLEEETPTQSKPEENQSEKANEITKDKISSKQSTEEKEVVMNSPVASPDEETFRNSNQEDEVKIVECYGEIINQKDETMKNTILNEELSEELERPDAGGERAVEDHHHSSAGNRTFTVSSPQDAHEGGNVEKAPIKIDLQRKHDGKDCGEPDKGETALSKEVNSSKVDLVKNGENILVTGDKEIMVRNYEVENLDLEISPVTDVVAEEATHEEVEEVFEPATKEPFHDTIETYDVQNEIENTNESESLEDDTKSMYTPLESALDRNCAQEEQRASAITLQFSTPTESLHEETEDRENGKMGDEKQHDFIPEEQAKDEVSIPEEMCMKDEGKHIKHESFILQEPIDLLTKEVRTKLDEAETKDREIQDQNVSSHTKDSDKEASQKVGTVDVTKCGEISQYIDKDPLAIQDGQILIEPNSTESTKATISTGNKDVSLVQQLESGNFLGAETKGKGVECQEEKRTGEECKDTTEKTISTDSDKISSPDILQGSSEGALNVAEDLTKERGLPENKEDLQDDKTETAEAEESKTDEDKDEDVEGDENKRVDSGSDAPVMVEASRDIDIKVSPRKKSHTSILSGVGSKVKHSIAKVKKVITGKSSHPKPSSPK